MGELMMLIETDKRGSEHAIPLTYALTTEDKFYVPNNLYFIGTMNTADRSLAMVDYALRRRFCFVNLEPAFETSKFNAFIKALGVPEKLIQQINIRLTSLNQTISSESKNLGPGFRIGHSYFCSNNEGEYNEKWYSRIVDYEIGPLLEEYWFDSLEKAKNQIDRLRNG